MVDGNPIHFRVDSRGHHNYQRIDLGTDGQAEATASIAHRSQRLRRSNPVHGSTKLHLQLQFKVCSRNVSCRPYSAKSSRFGMDFTSAAVVQAPNGSRRNYEILT
ncbi:hypothetical protein GCK32_007071 [Trichostrongylus colubriformis]|uniref:Uncharacterized protein n=1 Tax=Trichostrongylus colubriformis TaxID=6319 RepID=A0AAN8ES30_TRICO